MENRGNVISIAPTGGRRIWNFCYPHQIVDDPNMAVEEKRAILAAWASDVHAVDSLPTLRQLPGTPFPVALSSIMDALLQLDRRYGSDDDPCPPHRPRARQVTHDLIREAA